MVLLFWPFIRTPLLSTRAKGMETYCSPILSIACKETEKQGWSGKCVHVNLGNIFLSAADSVEHHAQVFL